MCVRTRARVCVRVRCSALYTCERVIDHDNGLRLQYLVWPP